MRAVGGVGAENEGAAVNKHDHLQSGYCLSISSKSKNIANTGSSFLGLRSGVKTARLRQSSFPWTEVAASAPVILLRMEAGRDFPGWGHDLRCESKVSGVRAPC